MGHGVVPFDQLDRELIDKNAAPLVAKIAPLLKESTSERILIEAMTVLSNGGAQMKNAMKDANVGEKLLSLAKHSSPAVAYHALLAFQATMDRTEFAKIVSDVKPLRNLPYWRVRAIAWDISDESVEYDHNVQKQWKPSAERKKDPIELVHLPMATHSYYSPEY